MKNLQLATLEGYNSLNGSLWGGVKKISRQTVNAVADGAKQIGKGANYLYDKSGADWVMEKTGLEAALKASADWLNDNIKRQMFRFVSAMAKKLLGAKGAQYLEKTTTPAIVGWLDLEIIPPTTAFILTIPGGAFLAPAAAGIIHTMLYSIVDQLKLAVINQGIKSLGLTDDEKKAIKTPVLSPEAVLDIQWLTLVESLKNADTMVVGPDIKGLFRGIIGFKNGEVILVSPAGKYGRNIKTNFTDPQEFIREFNFNNDQSLKVSSENGTIYSVPPADMAAEMAEYYRKKQSSNLLIPALAAAALFLIG